MGSFTVYHVNQGVSLAQAREKGQLVFIEGLKESLGVLLQGESSKGTQALDFLRDPSSGLRGLYDFVQDNVRSAVSGGEEWGPPCDPGGCPRCGPESGGQCWGSVGAALDFSHYCRATVCSELQVEVCWQGQCDRQQTQKKLFQYKVHDKGASFFARGTSSAVL
ncbi:elongator complex protein 6-like [Oncorhynchus kisutch]|uniref:elongator complex protein 6-like n=1 Tax=Oncorhynchus kisutch TaxID=8019 RepID=UPI0012DE0FAC|nr:elongator complex protein 6-like [Oncorhynchus kisutch]